MIGVTPDNVKDYLEHVGSCIRALLSIYDRNYNESQQNAERFKALSKILFCQDNYGITQKSGAACGAPTGVGL